MQSTGPVDMCFHARSITLPGLGVNGSDLTVTAPLPYHFERALEKLQLPIPRAARTADSRGWHRPGMFSSSK